MWLLLLQTQTVRCRAVAAAAAAATTTAADRGGGGGKRVCTRPIIVIWRLRFRRNLAHFRSTTAVVGGVLPGMRRQWRRPLGPTASHNGHATSTTTTKTPNLPNSIKIRPLYKQTSKKRISSVAGAPSARVFATRGLQSRKRLKWRWGLKTF